MSEAKTELSLGQSPGPISPGSGGQSLIHHDLKAAVILIQEENTDAGYGEENAQVSTLLGFSLSCCWASEENPFPWKLPSVHRSPLCRIFGETAVGTECCVPAHTGPCLPLYSPHSQPSLTVAAPSCVSEGPALGSSSQCCAAATTSPRQDLLSSSSSNTRKVIDYIVLLYLRVFNFLFRFYRSLPQSRVCLEFQKRL